MTMRMTPKTIIVLALLVVATHGFCTPRTAFATAGVSTKLHVLVPPSLWLADGEEASASVESAVSAVTDALPSSLPDVNVNLPQVQADDVANLAASAGGILQKVGIAVTAVLFFLAAVTFLYASFIIPAAAKELEKECKELRPDLWDEYVAKLEPGQSMAQRPDLMQELGALLQPLLLEKLEKMDANPDQPAVLFSPTRLEPRPVAKPVLDVEVEEKQQEDDEEESPDAAAAATPAEPYVISSGNQWDDDVQPLASPPSKSKETEDSEDAKKQ